MNQPASVPVVVILGPTAVGKTKIAIQIARNLGGEIVSADSRLLYRGMDIGTAKPTRAERMQVPHHLIDVAAPEDTWTLARYLSATKGVLEEIRTRGNLPLLVGGTGQYLMALLEGWAPPGRAKDDALRAKLETLAAEDGSQALHDRLRAIDPESAQRIDHRNVRRVVRALEIYHVTGIPPSDVRKHGASGLDDLRIGLTLPRPELYARIDARVDDMMQAGLLEEVRGLLERGVPPDAPAMSAIGYRQIVSHIQGELSLDEAEQEMRRATRQFVRRQANWFKSDDPRIHWFHAVPGVEEGILASIRSWLKDFTATH